ncbi:MAG: glucokinase [Actinomycetota bacterium]|nr:glucokinase [Actinomycetota bacterium]
MTSHYPGGMARRFAIGIDIGGTTTKAGVVTSEGEVLTRIERPTDPSAATKGAIALVDELLERSTETIAGLGVAAAGFITGSRVTFSPNLVFDDPQLGSAFEARSGLPVTVDNDANAAVWGEHRFGAARGIDNVAMVTIGTGIGSGFIIEGRLLRGASGAAGEIGHIVIDPAGPPCGCGLRGCLEQFASGQAVTTWARVAAEEDPSTSIVSFAGSIDAITAEHVGRAAREYDETARAVLRRAGRALGIGLSNIVNIFDPDVIVLGGSVTKAGEAFLGPARDELARMTAAQRRRPMRLDLSALQADAGILGAAALALDAT